MRICGFSMYFIWTFHGWEIRIRKIRRRHWSTSKAAAATRIKTTFIAKPLCPILLAVSKICWNNLKDASCFGNTEARVFCKSPFANPFFIRCLFMLAIQVPRICKFSYTCLSHTHVCFFVMCDLRIECHSSYAVGISFDELFGGGH